MASRIEHGAPNENLGREFLELFALGVGNYSERDVRETARALTGWQQVLQPSPEHSIPGEPYTTPGTKTILGPDGPLGRGRRRTHHFCTSRPPHRRIAWRLWRTFISNIDEPTDELLEGLAATIRVKGDVNVATATGNPRAQSPVPQ